MNIINIEHIHKIYGDKVIFDDVSCGIQEGDKIGIIGINGTGKSTLLEAIAVADGFNPEIKISARFDENGEKIIAAVVTSQECGAISGVITFTSNVEFDAAASKFIEENDDIKYYG